jgi:hypothetical protein
MGRIDDDDNNSAHFSAKTSNENFSDRLIDVNTPRSMDK